MVAEFARLLPRGILDSELSLLVKDKTTTFYRSIADVVTASSAVLSVSGRTGAVELTGADVGLGDVANIAPNALPISDATQQALDTKWGKEAPIPQTGVQNLPDDLAKRVQTVNGTPPDATGNVVVDTGQANFIPKPDDLPEDKEVLTWIVGLGWTPVSIQQHLLLGAGSRLLPDPASANAGDIATVVNGAWAAQPPATPILTSPNGKRWALRVDDTGALSTVEIV